MKMLPLNKGLLLAACVIGVTCSAGGVATYVKVLHASYKTKEQWLAAVCIILALSFYLCCFVTLLISVCGLLSDRCTESFINVIAGFCVFLTIAAYAAHNKEVFGGKTVFPSAGEWLFGGIVAGLGLFFLAALALVSNR
ncbi:hypothetical protein CRM22_001487 [Opisthorchis felineus]|uniref:MARVEL domain-containing protein n=1 Tax=Opisthorchis felineus TaxID=147828 RepID=A0A4V3SGT3_OPIFE|nr:hypothetical protein CRM22_001487 [Opisthorchis felineus]TGZ73485.1 hypothetical protein CRM22_001487 [Opisthorchis felineus]